MVDTRIAVDWLRRFLLLENVSSILSADMVELWEKLVEAIPLQSTYDLIVLGAQEVQYRNMRLAYAVVSGFMCGSSVA